MALTKVSAHIGKYEKIVIPDKEVREALVALVERHTEVEIPMGAVRVRQETILLQVSPILKTQILLKHEQIIEELFLLTKVRIKRIL